MYENKNYVLNKIGDGFRAFTRRNRIRAPAGC